MAVNFGKLLKNCKTTDPLSDIKCDYIRGSDYYEFGHT